MTKNPSKFARSTTPPPLRGGILLVGVPGVPLRFTPGYSPVSLRDKKIISSFLHHFYPVFTKVGQFILDSSGESCLLLMFSFGSFALRFPFFCEGFHFPQKRSRCGALVGIGGFNGPALVTGIIRIRTKRHATFTRLDNDRLARRFITFHPSAK